MIAFDVYQASQHRSFAAHLDAAVHTTPAGTAESKLQSLGNRPAATARRKAVLLQQRRGTDKGLLRRWRRMASGVEVVARALFKNLNEPRRHAVHCLFLSLGWYVAGQVFQVF